MTIRTLLILAHPSPDSFNAALADAYADAALKAGRQLRRIDLHALRFDPILHGAYRGEQALEADLQAAQADILWAEEIVWVYPVWWGGLPALLKGFLDRVLLPGFAYKFHKGHRSWDKLLKGRNARIVVTLDTPGWYDRLAYGRPAWRQMKHTILQFCGMKLLSTTTFAPIATSKPEQRERWLAEVRRLAEV
ncbi:MAG: NAD(P)H-dependent oxidoreductase [Burkholderiales bacterium]|nr:NAD(P)H-dependent oxidoreductase [Burkholderiales bacterium]MBH2017171.1 NAD(P)H-dependent oxidoreductase [Burkholderiales bacterium]